MTHAPVNPDEGTAAPALLTYFLDHQAQLYDIIRPQLSESGNVFRQSAEQVREQIAHTLGSYFRFMRDYQHEPILQGFAQQLTPQVLDHIPLDVVLQHNSIYRAAFLTIALEAMERGTEGASTGIKELMKLFDGAVNLISRRYQNQLRLFKKLAEYAPDGIGVAINGVISYANPALQQQMGYDMLIGMRVSDLFGDQDPEVLQDLRTSIAEDGLWKGRLTYRRKDGSEFIGDVSSYMIEGDSGDDSSVAIIRDISDQLAVEQDLRNFQLLVENAPDSIAIVDFGQTIRYANPAFHRLLHAEDSLVGENVSQFYSPDVPIDSDGINHEIAQSGRWHGQITYRRRDGSTVLTQSAIAVMHDLNGRPFAGAGIARDMTEQLRAEEERLQLQDQVIAAQQAALAELSTPMIPISDRVTVMPLIGSIDSVRAGQIVERLLEGIVEAHAEIAIIDITGVPVVDTQVAQTLLRAAQAASLVGARVILTGIRPEVAQTVVGLGITMNGVITSSTLQSGIATALARR